MHLCADVDGCVVVLVSSTDGLSRGEKAELSERENLKHLPHARQSVNSLPCQKEQYLSPPALDKTQLSQAAAWGNSGALSALITPGPSQAERIHHLTKKKQIAFKNKMHNFVQCCVTDQTPCLCPRSCCRGQGSHLAISVFGSVPFFARRL